MQEARFYDRIDAETVQCSLCPHRCRISEGKRGRCRARLCRGGTLYAATYGEAASLAMDPIEKKPLYHFYPGKSILSIGSYGCNFACPWCQNSGISQEIVSTRHIEPAQLVAEARSGGSVGIAYTYNEPLIQAEFVIDAARLAHQAGLVNVLVTNGFINPEPLAEIIPFVDAANLDLKSIRDDVYSSSCGGAIAPVLDTAKTLAREVHLEVTNLIITGLNDGDADLADLADWVAQHLGRETPVHLSRYFPHYRYAQPATSVRRMETAREIFADRLDYVYLGNMAHPEAGDTRCRSCDALLVTRRGYSIRFEGLSGDSCAACGAQNNFVSRLSLRGAL